MIRRSFLMSAVAAVVGFMIPATVVAKPMSDEQWMRETFEYTWGTSEFIAWYYLDVTNPNRLTIRAIYYAPGMKLPFRPRRMTPDNRHFRSLDGTTKRLIVKFPKLDWNSDVEREKFEKINNNDKIQVLRARIHKMANKHYMDARAKMAMV